MKKMIITTMIAAAMLTAGATNSYAAGNPFDGYAVTVYDQSTPAAYALGKDWPITTWYFYGSDGDVLGSVSNAAVMELAKAEHTDNVEWELRLADAFNDYRGVYDAADSAPSAKDFAMEVVELTNAERKKYGLHPLEVNDELMELAQIRAEEVSTKYSHERPDGTTVVETHGCGENIGARKTAANPTLHTIATEQEREVLAEAAGDLYVTEIEP